jgi:Uma2 family endonuclease
MASSAQHARASTAPPRLPTEDELPYEDGIPMETLRHRLQMELLIRGLDPWAAAQGDVFVSGNQFVYFSADQLRGQDFRGPGVFVACGVSRRERKSWVVWEEGKAPDVVIELLSETTAEQDKGIKRLIYQDQLRVANYYWLDPFNVEDRSGFTLEGRRYVPLPRDKDGCLPVPSLNLRLCLWQGEYLGVETTWLRWADDQCLLPLPEEAQRQRADQEQQRAEAAEQEIVRLRAELEQLRTTGRPVE